MRKQSWPPRALALIEADLDSLVASVENRPNARTDDEQTWLTKLLVVRLVGYLEQVVAETVRQHIREKSGGTVKTFSLTWVTRSRNPSLDNLVDMTGRFDAGFQASLNDLLDLDDQRLRRELGLLVARRHDIAHGLDGGLGHRKVLDLVPDVKLLATWFKETFDPGD